MTFFFVSPRGRAFLELVLVVLVGYVLLLVNRFSKFHPFHTSGDNQQTKKNCEYQKTNPVLGGCHLSVVKFDVLFLICVKI